jgi:hypothetical protein
MANYYPNFMIETKVDIDLNVKQKQRATLDFVRRINSLDKDLREKKT